MFVVSVDLAVKPGSQQNLETTYRNVFRPAISKQEGFRFVELLRPDEKEKNYRLALGFESQALQQRWVATETHQQVWPQMEGHCSGYSVDTYTAI